MQRQRTALLWLALSLLLLVLAIGYAVWAGRWAPLLVVPLAKLTTLLGDGIEVPVVPERQPRRPAEEAPVGHPLWDRALDA
jgi:hypothetical protein